jgi:hypothetical protein
LGGFDIGCGRGAPVFDYWRRLGSPLDPPAAILLSTRRDHRDGRA